MDREGESGTEEEGGGLPPLFRHAPTCDVSESDPMESPNDYASPQVQSSGSFDAVSFTVELWIFFCGDGGFKF